MAKDATTQSASEVVAWENGELEGIAAIEPTVELVEQAYAAIIEKKLPPQIGDPAIVARMILERVKKGTFDESMDPAESLPNWYETFGERVVVVYGFHLNKSAHEVAEGEFKGEKGVYAVAEVAAAGSGELVTVQTGGQNVLMQLVKAWEERRYPFQAVLTSTPTGSGRTTLWLKRPDPAA